ncbi:MAG: hypothetical protein LBD23_19110 [Oscillospiraceae bacterium]|jgi:hypothetical protein|nr:hypothetical protein [Oscillospiraceae bacterium]
MFEQTPIAGLEVYSCLRTRCADENDYYRFRESSLHCAVKDTTGGGVTDENGYFRFRRTKNKPRLSYFTIESEGKYIGTIPRATRVSHGFILMFVDGRADTVLIDMTGKTPHSVGFYFGKKVRRK